MSDVWDAWQGIRAVRAFVEREPVDAVLIHVVDADDVLLSDDLRNFAIEYLSFLGRRRSDAKQRKQQ